jgi:hypothetical protein
MSSPFYKFFLIFINPIPVLHPMDFEKAAPKQASGINKQLILTSNESAKNRARRKTGSAQD